MAPNPKKMLTKNSRLNNFLYRRRGQICQIWSNWVQFSEFEILEKVAQMSENPKGGGTLRKGIFAKTLFFAGWFHPLNGITGQNARRNTEAFFHKLKVFVYGFESISGFKGVKTAAEKGWNRLSKKNAKNAKSAKNLKKSMASKRGFRWWFGALIGRF